MRPFTQIVAFGCWLGFVQGLVAQLPTARLLTIFPPGGMLGTTCEVTVAGIDLDNASTISFSHSNITATATTNGAGRFMVSLGTNVPPGLYDARVIGRFGISNPRAFVVGEWDELIEKENDTVEAAMEVPLGTTVNGKVESAAVHYFKFQTKKGQCITVVCEAAAIDSRMDPSLILYSRDGRELKQSRRGGVLEFTATEDGYHRLKVHDFLFGGGNEHFYRLSIGTSIKRLQAPGRPIPALAENPLQETGSNDTQSTAQPVVPPCEVAGQFHPAADRDWYSFQAKKGDVYWIEVFSHRLGLPTDPLLVINDQEFSDIEANIGGVEFKTSSLDAVGRFEAKADGTNYIQVRDLFNHTVNDPRFAYRLVIRKESPDFELIAMPQAAPPKKDSREAFAWTSVLRRADTIPIKVLALRRDGFKGDISVQAADLPPGVKSSELIIPGDKSSGILLVTASEGATNWVGTITIRGKTDVGMRVAKPATVTWNVGDYNTEPVRSRLTDRFVLGVCDELAPITIEAAEARVFDAPASGKLAIPLNVVRRGEFTEAFKLKTYGIPALDSLKEIEVKEKGTNATVELDLSQQKLSPGSYAFYLQGQTKGKYRNAAEGEKAKPRDVTITMYSAPIALKVLPPQTAAK